ncbi:MAG TPA: 4-hydroxy-tetrahydrodipicolinate synthase [Desulfobacteria bacterium]|nr:4-hydroxy-tetrahydrodipicolinate synthase [Desulfobacteria bacterium]
MVFGRVITAMVTPFDSNLEVDYEKTRKLAKYLVENGSDGIVVAGTTGEASTLTSEEKVKLFATVVDEVGSKAKVIAGTGNNDTADSIALTKAAQEAGVHGIMAVVPYYNKPPQEGIYTHFRMIAEATDLPVMLYNIPGRSVINATPDTIARLAQIKNIVALKEAAGNLEQAADIRRRTPPEFVMYCGEDSLTLPMLTVGSSGVISVVSHVAGVELQNMIKAYNEGDVQKAQKIHLDLFPLFKGMFVTTNPIPVKAAMNLMGLEVGGLRPPMPNPTEEQTKFVEDLLKSYNKL